jgi:hypothetical protein
MDIGETARGRSGAARRTEESMTRDRVEEGAGRTPQEHGIARRPGLVLRAAHRCVSSVTPLLLLAFQPCGGGGGGGY